ncbi:MAG: CDP-diacylglycerol--glycerol-3-phosphate 3-phosphatidyltransferase [Clostridia bacterium]|nr:CDP-diacylglycerol--glycerol-3-phosphate 3-phosphatidyltransferase [Clostridia bacterium]
MNLPNKLSLMRVALIPVMVALMYPNTPVCNTLAAVVFALAAFTDFLDGYIARKNGLVTDFGKFVDPVADKLLVLSSLIMLVQHGLMLAWVVVVILARELCVDGLRMVAVSNGKVIAAGKLGKIKTCSQIALVLWLMLSRIPVMGSWIGMVLTAWVTVITLWSGIDYFVKNGSVIMNSK